MFTGNSAGVFTAEATEGLRRDVRQRNQRGAQPMSRERSPASPSPAAGSRVGEVANGFLLKANGALRVRFLNARAETTAPPRGLARRFFFSFGANLRTSMEKTKVQNVANVLQQVILK